MPGLAKNRAGMRPGQSHLISRCITVIVQSVGTVEPQKVHVGSRATRRLQPWQVLAPARARRWCTSAVGAGACARRCGELALAGVVLTSQHRQPAPAAWADLAPAHIQFPPAAGSFTPTTLMCATHSSAPMISMQQCIQPHLRPEQLLATSCKAKSRIRLESTIKNLSE